MTKKILFFIGCLYILTINSSHLLSNEKVIIPLKKPSLSKKEIEQKVSVNFLKPLPKPKMDFLTPEIPKMAENQKDIQKKLQALSK